MRRLLPGRRVMDRESVNHRIQTNRQACGVIADILEMLSVGDPAVTAAIKDYAWTFRWRERTGYDCF